jgi:hypothetical protein
MRAVTFKIFFSNEILTIICSGLILLLSDCYSPPEFPIEPAIEFEKIEFVEGSNAFDSLILTINFTDGDGDLGLGPAEILPPYNPRKYFYVNPGSPDSVLITYSQRSHPPFDTLPPYIWPYSCTNYIINNEIAGYQGDTLYYQTNENHWNIFVDYWVRKNGIWTEFDWVQCTDSFNGRFPSLRNKANGNPLSGSLRYGMSSTGFKLIFRQDTIKLKVRIKDRALHDSNIVETPEFILRDITVNAGS